MSNCTTYHLVYLPLALAWQTHSRETPFNKTYDMHVCVFVHLVDQCVCVWGGDLQAGGLGWFDLNFFLQEKWLVFIFLVCFIPFRAQIDDSFYQYCSPGVLVGEDVLRRHSAPVLLGQSCRNTIGYQLWHARMTWDDRLSTGAVCVWSYWSQDGETPGFCQTPWSQRRSWRLWCDRGFQAESVDTTTDGGKETQQQGGRRSTGRNRQDSEGSKHILTAERGLHHHATRLRHEK